MLISAVSVAPPVSIAVAFAWLVAAHHLLPLADRLERRPGPDDDDEPADAWPAATDATG